MAVGGSRGRDLFNPVFFLPGRPVVRAAALETLFFAVRDHRGKLTDACSPRDLRFRFATHLPRPLALGRMTRRMLFSTAEFVRRRSRGGEFSRWTSDVFQEPRRCFSAVSTPIMRDHDRKERQSDSHLVSRGARLKLQPSQSPSHANSSETLSSSRYSEYSRRNNETNRAQGSPASPHRREGLSKINERVRSEIINARKT